MNPVWHIRLFGELSGYSETGARFTPGISLPGALLACLALAPNRSLTRENLAALLWPDSDTVSGRSRLRNELRVLRRQLEPDGAAEGSVLRRERERIALAPGTVVTDVEQFNAAFSMALKSADASERESLLAQAAALYTGELLPGYDFEGIEAERSRLAQSFEKVLHELAALRQDPKRTVKEICETLQISEATFYRYTTAQEEKVQVHDAR